MRSSVASRERGPSRPPVSRVTPSVWWGRYAGSSLGFSAVGGVGEGEEAGDVGIARAILGKESEAGVVGEGKFAAGDGPDAQVAWAMRANSKAPHRLVSVRARAG